MLMLSFSSEFNQVPCSAQAQLASLPTEKSILRFRDNGTLDNVAIWDGRRAFMGLAPMAS